MNNIVPEVYIIICLKYAHTNYVQGMENKIEDILSKTLRVVHKKTNRYILLPFLTLKRRI